MTLSFIFFKIFQKIDKRYNSNQNMCVGTSSYSYHSNLHHT